MVLGVTFVKLLPLLYNMIRRQLQQVSWRVEVVSDDDPRVHPTDPRGVCSYVHCLPVEIWKICDI